MNKIPKKIAVWINGTLPSEEVKAQIHANEGDIVSYLNAMFFVASESERFHADEFINTTSNAEIDTFYNIKAQTKSKKKESPEVEQDVSPIPVVATADEDDSAPKKRRGRPPVTADKE